MFKKKKQQKLTVTKTILEYDSSNGYNKIVQSAVTMIPDWYKETKRWVEIPEDLNRGIPEWPGLKHCLPFLDALSLGYYILLDQDVTFKRVDGHIVVEWDKKLEHELGVPLESRPPHVTNPMMGPAGYGDEFEHFHWFLHVSIRPPDGYSMIVTHPFNRFELPFYTLTGVVDDYAMPGANASFYLKKDFEGTIPAGTPIAQVIPFRREEWKLKQNPNMWHESRSQMRDAPKLDELLEGWYRKNVWKKKSYR